MNVTVQVNGEPRAVAARATITGLLAELQLPANGMLVEHNGVALFRSDWDAVTVAEGDRVEVIRVVAGG